MDKKFVILAAIPLPFALLNTWIVLMGYATYPGINAGAAIIGYLTTVAILALGTEANSRR
jgi:hypothetical protein